MASVSGGRCHVFVGAGIVLPPTRGGFAEKPQSSDRGFSALKPDDGSGTGELYASTTVTRRHTDVPKPLGIITHSTFPWL